MNIKGLNFFKSTIFSILILISIYLLIKGNSKLHFKKTNDSHLLNDDDIDNLNNSKIDTIINKLNEKKIIPIEKRNYEKNRYPKEIIIVKKNDTFSKLIDPFFDNKKLKNQIINKINEKYNLKNLKIGQKIYFNRNNSNKITEIIFPINFSSDFIVKINSNNIDILNEKIDIIKEIKSLEFKIISSLYQEGINAKVPISILSAAVKLYSFDIDFQRDIQKNTKFEVSYETFYNAKRNTISYGDIHYINLIIQGKKLEYFLFKTDDEYNDYFNREGKNIKKALLKTPLDGARLSSNFGMRKHPISGFNKLHKGVDFAAPTGTPIYAGGNGIIEFIGNNKGYGKYIKIRHNNNYKTAYAHLKSFKKDISKGIRVNQGDIIGYVGSTGNSTGPHLHYEIIYNNKQINPMKMKLPSGKILKGDELDRFKKEVNNKYAKHLFVLYE